MSKISYIILPKHEARQYASAELSSRVIANAMRLLIAVILMSALVAIIILASHRVVDVQPVQPWTLAPAPVPSTLESPPPVKMERKYILCMSELSNRSSDLKWGKLSKTEDRVMQRALDLFKQCAVIKVQLDVGRQLRQPNVSTNSNRWIRERSCQRSKDLPESKPKLVEYLDMRQQSVPVYSTDDKQIFSGTPFLSKWQDLQDLFDNDVLDRCIRLMLVWRYGGLACNLDEATGGLLHDFKSLLDTRGESVLLTANSTVIYSKHSCHAAIGTMLVDYAKFSLQLPHDASNAKDHEKKIMQRVEQLFEGAVYVSTTSGYSPDMQEDLPCTDCFRGPLF